MNECLDCRQRGRRCGARCSASVRGLGFHATSTCSTRWCVEDSLRRASRCWRGDSVSLDLASGRAWHWWLSEVATLQPCSTAVACGSQAIPSLDFGCAARPASVAMELVTGFSQAPKAECSSKAKCSAIRRVPQGPRRCCCECFCDRLHRLDRPLRGCRTLIALKA